MQVETAKGVVDQFVTISCQGLGGEPVDVFAMLDDQVQYTRHGLPPIEAKCSSLGEVREKVFPPEVLAAIKPQPGFGIYPTEYIEEGNRIVVLMKGRGANISDVPYNNTYFFLFEIRNNKILRVIEDLDASLSWRCFYSVHLEEDVR